jgi:hypothetical protein
MEIAGNLIKPTPFMLSDIRRDFEFIAAEPDSLRDAVCSALSSLTDEQRASVGNKLLAELSKVGLRVRESFLKLGVSASTLGELTAPEIAALIRYVRLAKPNLMLAVAEPLSELLATPDLRVQPGSKRRRNSTPKETARSRPRR